MPSVERSKAATQDLARAGGLDATVEIVEYDPAWPALYAAERERLKPFLAGADLHHFGSTAVPGLAAKPVIDMIALVADLDAPIAALVSRAGYQFPKPSTRRSHTGASSATRPPPTAPITCTSWTSRESWSAACASVTACAPTRPRRRIRRHEAHARPAPPQRPGGIHRGQERIHPPTRSAPAAAWRCILTVFTRPGAHPIYSHHFARRAGRFRARGRGASS